MNKLNLSLVFYIIFLSGIGIQTAMFFLYFNN